MPCRIDKTQRKIARKDKVPPNETQTRRILVEAVLRRHKDASTR